MIFFYKIFKFTTSTRMSSGFQSSENLIRPFEKLVILHDQSAFSLIFFLSLLIHFILVLAIGMLSDLFVEDPPPIKARIGVSYSEIISKPTLIKRTGSVFEKPVLKKIESSSKPKIEKTVTKKYLPKKPTIKNSLKHSKLPKRFFNKTETQRLEISKPKLTQKSAIPKKEKILKPKLLKNLQKTFTLKKQPSDGLSNIKNLPKFSNNNIQLSPIKSKESLLKPNKIDVPRFSQNKLPQKKIAPSKISDNFIPSKQINSILDTDRLEETPKISGFQSEKNIEPIDNLFSEKEKKNTPLPENIIIPDDKIPNTSVSVPNIKDIQKRKETQLAIDDYNNHISSQIKPNGQFEPGLFVRFLLTINPSGEIVKYEFIEKSGFSPFDLAAELAVRNAVLDPLPKALAENPPYIVPIRIVPQN